jgi:diguanylate cyclase
VSDTGSPDHFPGGATTVAAILSRSDDSRHSDSTRHLHTRQLARRALDLIDSHGLAADPDSFELWFTYAAATNLPLNSALDQAVDSPDGLTESKIDHLSSTFLPSRINRSRLTSAAKGLSDEVAQVMGMIMAHGATSNAYAQQLGDGLVEFERQEYHDALRPIVEALVVATRQMEAETRALRLQLEHSKENGELLQQKIETLRKENLTDGLTLIGNRQYLDETLRHAVVAAARTRRALSILFCDIDHFKDFNDRFGHQVGDQVLRLVADLIKGNLRGKDDVVGRYGGEEFGVILPDATLEAAQTIAERIRASLAGREVKKRKSNQSFGNITVSIGVAQLQMGESAEDFIRRVDDCLYAAKRAGRNRVISEQDIKVLCPR